MMVELAFSLFFFSTFAANTTTILQIPECYVGLLADFLF